jgi:prefoldin subunit 5
MDGDLVTKSLNDRIGDNEALISSIGSEVSAARKGKTDLVTKINEIDSNISSLSGGISSINQTFAEASYSTISGSHGSVNARLEYDEALIRD